MNEDPNHNPAVSGDEPPGLIRDAVIDRRTSGCREFEATIKFLDDGAVGFDEFNDFVGNENIDEEGRTTFHEWRLEAEHRDSLFTAFLHPVPETEEERRRLLVEALKVAMKTSRRITGGMKKAGIKITRVREPWDWWDSF